MANGNNRGVRDAVVKGVFGVGAGVISDFFVEFFNVPVLQDKGMFGNTKQNNYEIIVYAISGGGAVAGIMDYFSNSRPLGFTKEFIPYFIGFGIGTGLFENLLKPALGLEKYNPYEMIYNAIPSVPLL